RRAGAGRIRVLGACRLGAGVASATGPLPATLAHNPRDAPEFPGIVRDEIEAAKATASTTPPSSGKPIGRYDGPSLLGQCRLSIGSIPPNPCHPERSEGSNPGRTAERSEEHTSELQSRENLVCRLL